MAKKKKEKNKKQKIRIFFKDGCCDVIPQRLWDNYDYIPKDGVTTFVVKRKGQWIGMYNMDDVSCVVVG